MDTDETFTLLKGRAVLITYDKESDTGELTSMKSGYTYNVPRMMWHNIAMEEGSSVIITENRDAHIKGLEQISLPEELRHTIMEFTCQMWG